MPTRRRGVALAFATAGLVLFTGWLMWHRKGPTIPESVANVAANPFSMFATACAVGAALRTTCGRRIGWLCECASRSPTSAAAMRR
jgi:hypothetical protein